MNNKIKAGAVKLGTKLLMKVAGVELLGEGGVLLYEVGKEYLPESAKTLVSETLDSGIDMLSDRTHGFAQTFFAKKDRDINPHLARGVCKAWQESLIASLAENRAANIAYVLLPKNEFQEFDEQLKFLIDKFKEAQTNDLLLRELFYGSGRSESDFDDAFFSAADDEVTAENIYWANLESTILHWLQTAGKLPAEWENGFPENFGRELREFLFGNLRIHLKNIFDENEQFRNAFIYSINLAELKHLKHITGQVAQGRDENRAGFEQVLEQISALGSAIEDISDTIKSQFDSAFTGNTRKDGASLEETDRTIKTLSAFVVQLLIGLSAQPAVADGFFTGFNRSFPRVPDYFTGRIKVLHDLENTLKEHRQASFYGTHGLGKTRTAIEYAFRHEGEYSFILFISTTKGSFINNAAFTGTEISQKIQDAQTLEAKYNLFIDYLQKHSGWLIICDNVEDVTEVAGKIPAHFDGHVIYTSNLPEIEDTAPPVKIEAMTQNEAELALLRRKAGDNEAQLKDVAAEERVAITRIVEKIGTLPVGLTLAGAFIKKYRMNFCEYLQNYEQFEDETFQNFDLADYYGEEFIRGLSETEKAEYKGIAGVFLLSYSRIVKPRDESSREKLISETIAAVLNLSAFFAPEKVPEELWFAGLNLLDEDLAEAAKNHMFWLEARNRMMQSAFCVRDETENTYNTHRLILTILQKRLNKEEKSRFAALALESVNKVFPQVPDFNHWKECARLLRHVETVLDHAENFRIETQTVARLYNQLAYYIDDLAEYERAVTFYKKALLIDEKTIGKEHPGYAACLNNLATVYQSQGRYDEAIEQFEEALEIGEKTIGKEHPDYAISLNNLALVYKSQGRYDEAIEKYKEALRIGEKTLGNEHPGYATRLNNLANVYQAQGRYEEAIEQFEEALRIDEMTIGKEHPGYATDLNNLGNVYASQGRYEEAIEKYKEALRIGEMTIGKEHPIYAIRLGNLAAVYEDLGKYKDAVELYEQALIIEEKTLPQNHPNKLQKRTSVERCRSKIAAQKSDEDHEDMAK